MKQDYKAFGRENAGFSVMELLLVVSITAIIGSTLISNYRELNDPLQNTTNQLVTQLKAARIKAISTTSSYMVQPISTSKVLFKYGNTCATATTTDDELTINFPTTVRLDDTTWSVCFSPRGLADASLDIDVLEGGRLRIVEVMIGGSVRAKKSS